MHPAAKTLVDIAKSQDAEVGEVLVFSLKNYGSVVNVLLIWNNLPLMTNYCNASF